MSQFVGLRNLFLNFYFYLQVVKQCRKTFPKYSFSYISKIAFLTSKGVPLKKKIKALFGLLLMVIIRKMFFMHVNNIQDPFQNL